MAANDSDCPNSTDVVKQDDWTAFHSLFFPARAIAQIMLLWIACGVPGSVLSIVIWTRKRMRHSSSVYLSALAVADLTVLLLAIFLYLEQAWGVHTLNFPYWCQIFPTTFIWAQYSCTIVTLAFTVERYISVCHPFQHERFCTMARATRATAAILVCCLLPAMVQCAVHRYDDVDQVCTSAAWVGTPLGARIYKLWAWVSELLVFGLVPVSILVFNLLVIAEMRRMSRRDTAIGAGAVNSKATTITLLCVSFCLIGGTLPPTLVFSLTKSFPEGERCIALEAVLHDATWRRYLTFNTAKLTINMLCSAHYALNFYIYLLTGSAFRREAVRLVRECFRRDRRAGQRRCYSHMMSTARSLKEHNGNVDTTFV